MRTFVGQPLPLIDALATSMLDDTDLHREDTCKTQSSNASVVTTLDLKAEPRMKLTRNGHLAGKKTCGKNIQ